MKAILSLLLSINTIINPFVVNAGGTYSNIIQASYSYGIGYFNVGTASGDPLNSQYFIDIDINIQGTYSGYVYINVTQPSSTMSSSYYPKYISIGANYVGSGYTNAGYTQFCFKISSSSHFYVRLYYGVGTLQQYYGLTNGANQDLNWTNSGNQYVNVTSISVSNFVKETDTNTYLSDIETIINTIKNNTDSLENYIAQLISVDSNIYSAVSGISTNIVSIKNVLDSINTKLDTLDNIKWNLINITYKGYTTDYQTFNTDTYGYHDAGWYVLENPDFNSSVSSGIYKLTIPLGAYTTTFNNIKLAQYWENAWREFTPDTYLYYATRNYIVIYFTVSETYHQWPQSEWPLGIYIDKRLYKYSAYSFKLEYILQTDENYWSVFNTMKQFAHMKTIENDLQQIISILGTTDISTTDNQNKQTVDNKFNQLIQNLTLPEVPNQPSKLPFIQHLFQVYGEIINIPGLDIFKWFMGMQAIVMLLGVILK